MFTCVFCSPLAKNIFFCSPLARNVFYEARWLKLFHFFLSRRKTCKNHRSPRSVTCVGLETCLKIQKCEIYDKNIIFVLLLKCLQFRNVRKCFSFCGKEKWNLRRHYCGQCQCIVETFFIWHINILWAQCGNIIWGHI